MHTWISRVLGMHRKFTVADSFFINSEAMSPSPAPCSQSRTRSKFVRIWTALDQEKSPSWMEENEEPRHKNMSQMMEFCDGFASPPYSQRLVLTFDPSPLSSKVLSREVLVKKKR